jgi:anti-sigma B factor antagonist
MSLRKDGSIHIEVRPADAAGITIVDVTGVVDTGTTLLLDDRLSSLLREQQFKLVLNMENVSYVSSAGWGLFISLLQKTREHGGDIKLAALSKEVKSVFNLLAFSNLITSYKTTEEAGAAFRHA